MTTIYKSLLWTVCGGLLSVCQTVAGQELIANGGFETYRTCPRQDNLLAEAPPWYNPNAATPDFYNYCFPTAQIELPPRTGRGLGRLFVDDGFAEYMATPLKKPLVADKCYAFELYISTGDPGKYLTGTMGAYFSDKPLTSTAKDLLTANPQVLDSQIKSVTNRFKWERIGGTFKAKGGEQYVTIGSFKQLPKFLSSYYMFLDDISLKPIEMNLGNDTTLCGRKSTLPLNATTPGAIEYRWQDGSTTPIFTVTKPGTYSVTVTTPCTVLRDTIRVDYALPFSLGPDTTLCNGRAMTLQGPANAPNYRWQDGSAGNSLAVSQPGTYSLRISQGGCVVTDSIRVAYTEGPRLNLGPDKALCGAETYVIQPTFAEGTFRWQDAANDPPERTVSRSDTYRASVSNACATVSDSVRIDYGDCGCVIYAPDTFTPNADGHNDVFQPIACGDITFRSLSVFTRWGELIFRTEAAPFRWDGFLREAVCPGGMYSWQVEYDLRQGERTSRSRKDGRLLLLR